MAEIRLLLVTGSTRRLSTNRRRPSHCARRCSMPTQQRCTTGCRTSSAFNPRRRPGTPPRGCAGAPRAHCPRRRCHLLDSRVRRNVAGELEEPPRLDGGGGEIYGKPAAWINVAPPGRGDGADAALRVVLGYVGARVLESSGIRVPVSHDSVGPDGLIGDPATRAALGEALANILAELETLPSEEA